uniref:Uncharacterized protein n=1 Tax=Aegilops tauschii subsp. strangulata TaxID=200361 RepID=A0A452YE68_AEGTS
MLESNRVQRAERERATKETSDGSDYPAASGQRRRGDQGAGRRRPAHITRGEGPRGKAGHVGRLSRGGMRCRHRRFRLRRWRGRRGARVRGAQGACRREGRLLHPR